MWVLLSSQLRRWVIFAIAVPLGAKLIGVIARKLEQRAGAPTKTSKVLRSAADRARRR